MGVLLPNNKIVSYCQPVAIIILRQGANPIHKIAVVNLKRMPMNTEWEENKLIGRLKIILLKKNNNLNNIFFAMISNLPNCEFETHSADPVLPTSIVCKERSKNHSNFYMKPLDH